MLETQGDLTYEGARKALRLLGSKFFHELKSGTNSNNNKTYDINLTETPEEAAMWVSEAEAYEKDALVQMLHENGDEDAAFILDFEDSVIDAVQESPELASCYHTYLEARTRLRERAKFRGFWAITAGQKGKGKKGKGALGKGQSGLHARCGQMGHWKRECPMASVKGESKGKNPSGETISLAEALVMMPGQEDDIKDDDIIEEMPMELPEGAEYIGLKEPSKICEEYVFYGKGIENAQVKSECSRRVVGSDSTQHSFPTHQYRSKMFQQSVQALSQKNFKFKRAVQNMVTPNFQQKLQTKLQNCCRKHGRIVSSDTTAVNPRTEPPVIRDHFGSQEPVVILSCEESAGEAVIDTGASRTVIGESRVGDLVQYVSQRGMSVQRVPSKVQFRFGNSGTLQSRYALCIPRQQKGRIRVEIVPGHTPFRELLLILETNNSDFMIMNMW